SFALWLNRQLLQKLFPWSFPVERSGVPAAEPTTTDMAATASAARNQRRLVDLIGELLSSRASEASAARCQRRPAAPAPTRTRGRGTERRRTRPGPQRRRTPSSRPPQCRPRVRVGAGAAGLRWH